MMRLQKGATYGDAIVLGVVRAAIKGKTDAAREIRESIEGKSTQRIEFADTTFADTFEKMNEAELEAYASEAGCPTASRFQETIRMARSNDGARCPFRLAEWPVGSAESRLAARALLEARRAASLWDSWGKDRLMKVSIEGITPLPPGTAVRVVRNRPKQDEMTETPDPARFALGTTASRAAARMLLEKRRKNKTVFGVIIELVGHPPGKPVPEGSRTEGEHRITEFVYIPSRRGRSDGTNA